MSPQAQLFYRFGIALLIGFLIGLQREFDYDVTEKSEEKIFAGVRTFSLIALTGCSAALLSDLFESSWIFLGVFLSLTLMIAVAYYLVGKKGSVGMTTEIAALLTGLVGALAYWEQIALAVALGVVITALLSFKLELHGLAERLNRQDVLATLKFAIITAIILPVLPNEPIWDQPPFDVLVPYKIWLMVVLISGISFSGYILIKLVGSRRGIGLTGLLGGLASSTAVTLSFAQRSRNNTSLGKPFALAIMLAWTVMFGRVLIEVAVVHAPLLQTLWLPITAAGLLGLGYGLYLFFSPRADDEEDVEVSNPFELGPAITFGLLYGLILLVTNAAEQFLGSTGLYLSSIISGLADVDAITLTTAELSRNGTIEQAVATRAIVLAVVSNTSVKGVIVLSTGSAALRRAILPGFILTLGAAVVLAFVF
jgi:uncharacterized membrane protein (DUF4010 family)